MRSASASTAKHVIGFDHHAPKLRDHNTEQLKELMYNEGGCPLGWSNAHDGFWAIWGYDALYDAAGSLLVLRSLATGAGLLDKCVSELLTL